MNLVLERLVNQVKKQDERNIFQGKGTTCIKAFKYKVSPDYTALIKCGLSRSKCLF